MHSRPPRLIRTLPSLEKRREDLGNLLRKSYPPPPSSALGNQLLRQTVHPMID